MSEVRVSVVIPAYNEAGYIERALESVFAQDPPPDEVIVVDNASSDNTGEIAAAFGARVIREEKRGVHHARQTGLLAARYPVVAQIDADTLAQPGWMRAIKRVHADDEVLASFGPVGLYEAPLLDRLLAELFFTPFLWLGAKLGRPNLNGANHAVKKAAALAVGGYERPFAEDVHLGLKLVKRGRVVFVPDQRVLTSGRRLKKGRLAFYGVHLKNMWRRALGLPEDYSGYFEGR